VVLEALAGVDLEREELFVERVAPERLEEGVLRSLAPGLA